MAGVDLDALEHRAESAKPSELFAWVVAIAPELRAAREVVEAAARLRRQPDSRDANLLLALDLALDAYDQAIGRPAAADRPPGER